jgi:Cu/Ag efflux protein CusF
MTMVFTVRNKALLNTVQTGDRVKFKAVKEDGRYMVVELQPAS